MAPAIADEPVVARTDLGGGSWVDVARGFLTEPDEVHRIVGEATRWSPERTFHYDHWKESNRLGSSWRRGDPVAHPVLLDAHRWLQHRYGVRFEGFALVRYRDEGDGQGFHRDREHAVPGGHGDRGPHPRRHPAVVARVPASTVTGTAWRTGAPPTTCPPPPATCS